MKVHAIIVTVAIVGGVPLRAFGQVQALRGFGQPAPAPALSLDDDRLLVAQQQSAELDSDLEFLDLDEPENLPTYPPPSQNSYNINDRSNSQPIPESRNERQDLSDPQSLRTSHANRSSVIDAVNALATIEGVSDCRTTPVSWDEAYRTPNPVASVLLREQCVAGLWDGYEAQRAAECARMWEKIAGHPRCGCACQPSCAAGCAPCGVQVNRYLQTPAACDQCNEFASSAIPQLSATNVSPVAGPVSLPPPPPIKPQSQRIAQFPPLISR
ncbi:MAG: hypothetical protein KDB22_00145 [Planctomycetales bacterium]|nr:hypothetical protein [Planctomycetales bacterium]